MNNLNQANIHPLIALIASIIHAFQKERGSLCLYLSDHDQTTLVRFNDCVDKSDRLLRTFRQLPNQLIHLLNPEQLASYHKLSDVFKGFTTKAHHRHHVEEIEIDIKQVIPLYAHELISHTIYVLIELLLFDQKNSPAQVSSITNFFHWKERIGRERALGVLGFGLSEFDSEQFVNDFKLILDEQKVNKRSFLALASLEQRNVFEKQFSLPIELEQFHQLFEKQQQQFLTATAWFNLQTSNMDMMHDIELKLLQQFYTTDGKPPQHIHSQINTEERNLILDFPLFRNLSNDILEALLKSGKINDHKKGNLLFLQGEQASRIYVVISGWIKIFKSNPDGCETIEQMLTVGDVAIESSIFSNSSYCNNAQVSSSARLFSFPAAIYRNLVKKDLTLALNSLKYLSQNSRNHLNQIDANRSKSSKERVGTFLLKQFIEQKNPNTIYLPYEKTIIASVLDMKPETFSRSLQSLKKNGLSSEKQQIQVENIKVLCDYCDQELAARCQFKANLDCKQKKHHDKLQKSTEYSV